MLMMINWVMTDSKLFNNFIRTGQCFHITMSISLSRSLSLLHFQVLVPEIILLYFVSCWLLVCFVCVLLPAFVFFFIFSLSLPIFITFLSSFCFTFVISFVCVCLSMCVCFGLCFWSFRLENWIRASYNTHEIGADCFNYIYCFHCNILRPSFLLYTYNTIGIYRVYNLVWDFYPYYIALLSLTVSFQWVKKMRFST